MGHFWESAKKGSGVNQGTFLHPSYCVQNDRYARFDAFVKAG